MDRLDELAILVAIIDHGSLAVAGRRLRRSPPAVTRALANLEGRAGTRLVERTTRRLSPTAAGRALAERARALLTEYDSALTGSSNTDLRGVLRVTAPMVFGRLHVAPLIGNFLERFPELQVELVLDDQNLPLIEAGLDVAVRIGPLSDSSLLVRRVGEVRRIVVASPEYLQHRGVPQRPADLSSHDTLFGTSRSAPPEWHFGPPRRARARLSPRLLVNDVEAQLVAARAGRGIARVLSYQVVADLASGTLVRLLRPFEPPPLPVQLVTHGRTHMPVRVRLFFDFAAQALSELPVVRRLAIGARQG